MRSRIKEKLQCDVPDDQVVIKIIEVKTSDSFLLSMLTLLARQISNRNTTEAG